MGDQWLFLNSVEKIPFFNDRLTMSQIIVCLFEKNRHKYRPVSGDAYRSEPLSTKEQCHICISYVLVGLCRSSWIYVLIMFVMFIMFCYVSLCFAVHDVCPC